MNTGFQEFFLCMRDFVWTTFINADINHRHSKFFKLLTVASSTKKHWTRTVVLFKARSMIVIFCKGYYWNVSPKFPRNSYTGFFMLMKSWARHIYTSLHVSFQNWGFPISFCFFVVSTKKIIKSPSSPLVNWRNNKSRITGYALKFHLWESQNSHKLKKGHLPCNCFERSSQPNGRCQLI